MALLHPAYQYTEEGISSLNGHSKRDTIDLSGDSCNVSPIINTGIVIEDEIMYASSHEMPVTTASLPGSAIPDRKL